jgi:hypothetical protein
MQRNVSDRMIEALMFGQPYEGRLADFSAPREQQPLSPTVAAQRRVREEQDAAYRESLQVCLQVCTSLLP